MKTLVLTLALLTSITAHGAVALYHGNARGVLYGNSQTVRATGRAYLILDTDTLDAYQVTASTVRGIKFYTVERLNDRTIGDANTGTAIISYLAKASTGSTVDSSLLKGKYSLVTIDDSGTQKFLPRTFTGTFFTGNPGQETFGEGTSIYSLDVKNSKISNAGGLTLLDVLDVVEKVFQKLGYSRFDP